MLIWMKAKAKRKAGNGPSKLKIQIGVILALVFLVWILLQNPAVWS